MKYGYLYIGSGITIVIIGSLLIFFVFGSGILSGIVWTHVGVAQSNYPVANYEIDFYSDYGHTIVKTINSDINGHYSIQLPAGNYFIYTKGQALEPVKVIAGQNTTFDVLVK